MQSYNHHSLWEALQQCVTEKHPSLGGPMQHGQPLSLNEDTLVVGFTHRFSLEYLRDPDNFVFVSDTAQMLLKKRFYIDLALLTVEPKTEFKKTWNNLNFRSESEVRIAQALDKLNILFFPNCKGRLGTSRARENREADFLICYKSKWGILEVDGEPFHPPSRTVADHARDRLFKYHGIPVVEHFDAAECFENAEKVVRQFLAILSQNG
jgi:hypothetical protein